MSTEIPARAAIDAAPSPGNTVIVPPLLDVSVLDEEGVVSVLWLVAGVSSVLSAGASEVESLSEGVSSEVVSDVSVLDDVLTLLLVEAP